MAIDKDDHYLGVLGGMSMNDFGWCSEDNNANNYPN